MVRVGRRGFLGLSVAAAGGVAVGAWRSRVSVRWLRQGGFPDGPAVAEIAADGVADGERVALTLRIETPAGVHVRTGGEALVRGGWARATLPLVYPYDERVPGTYRYHLEARVGAEVARTRVPATYSVRRMVFFS